jgi:hypothetical protein
MAYYHKDIDATLPTASLFINKAKVGVKGVDSTLVGTSTLKVSEIVIALPLDINICLHTVLYQTPVGLFREAEILLISSSFSLALMFNAKM